MKALHLKKVLGVALQEHSLLVAEIAAGDRPQLKQVAEMVYPSGITLQQPTELGKVLSAFLKEREFSTRQAVIGLPLKWLVVKSKEVPAAEEATLSSILRLEAEAEFSSELKDLVYDFAPDAPTGAGRGEARTVLLAATPRKYLELVESLCEAARVEADAIMPTAMALSGVTQEQQGRNLLVLSVASSGSEFSASGGGMSGWRPSIRTLRAPTPPPAFFSELRRVISAFPGNDREMVLWDQSGLRAAEVGDQLGLPVKVGELASLGVETNGSSVKGEGARFGGAVALGLVGISETAPAVNFLRSRLAPPSAHLIPRWAWYAAGALVAVIIGIVFAYHYLGGQQAEVDALKSRQDAMASDVANAQKFVSKVTAARYWHNESDARYLACLRDIDSVIPEDGSTYATSLDIKAPSPSLAGSGMVPNGAAASTLAKQPDMRTLQVTLQGRTPNFDNVTAIESRMRRMPGAFLDIKLGPQTKVPRTSEILFSVTFTYVPPAPTGTPSQPAAPAEGMGPDNSVGDSGGQSGEPVNPKESQGSPQAASSGAAALPPVPLKIEIPTTAPADANR